MSIRIGYQGVINSNSYEVTKLFIEKNNFTDVKMVPLVSSLNVVNALKKKEIDYGVVAIRNCTAGIVEETKKALNNLNYSIIDNLDYAVHHCLFIKDKNSRIKKIATHIQAYKQCLNHIKDLYGDIEFVELEDTAIGAEYLSSDKLDKNTGIICSKNAGMNNNLYLLKENIEDNKKNYTEFILFERK